jgi:hypothetical protein
MCGSSSYSTSSSKSGWKVWSRQLYRALERLQVVNAAILKREKTGDVGTRSDVGSCMVPESWSGLAFPNEQAVQGRIDPQGCLHQLMANGSSKAVGEDHRPLSPSTVSATGPPQGWRTHEAGTPVSERLDCGSICVLRLM